MGLLVPFLKYGLTFGAGVGAGIYMAQNYKIIFGAGLYTGVYVAQNYQIEKVENPKVLLEKATAFLKDKLDNAGKKD